MKCSQLPPFIVRFVWVVFIYIFLFLTLDYQNICRVIDDITLYNDTIFYSTYLIRISSYIWFKWICSFQSHVWYFFHVNNFIIFFVLTLNFIPINKLAKYIIITYITISTTWFYFLVPILKWLNCVRCLTHLNEYVCIGNLF